MLVSHGKMPCARCWQECAENVQERGAFRLVRDPGHWGAANPSILVLGISKGNTQSSAYAADQFEAVAFKGIRHRILEIFHSVGLLPQERPAEFERRFGSAESEYAFASVVRCSLTGWDRKKRLHTADSPNVLPAFRSTSDANQFVANCVDEHLNRLPSRTRTILLLGNTDAYVSAMADIISRVRGPIERVNEMAFHSNGTLFVHLGHPSKGNGHFGAYVRGEGRPGAKRDMARAALAA